MEQNEQNPAGTPVQNPNPLVNPNPVNPNPVQIPTPGVVTPAPPQPETPGTQTTTTTVTSPEGKVNVGNPKIEDAFRQKTDKLNKGAQINK